MKCAICGKEVNPVQAAFTLVRWGVVYCYADMKATNAERRVWKDDLKYEKKSKKK